MKTRYGLSLLLAALLPALALGELRIAATSTSAGALARAVGGDSVEVTVLAPPDRDLHSLQVRPSMMRALRQADLVVALGAELEVGWLPPALRGAANPVILPGRAGYFELAAHVPLRDTDLPADRGLGDVHPGGNPHVNMDPVRMAMAGHALAARMAEIDTGNADAFRRRAARFAEQVDGVIPRWRATVWDLPGVVPYHKDIDYLLERLEVPVLGYVEPLPGVPPGASHLSELVGRLRGTRGVVAQASYQPPRAAETVARDLGWQVVRLPLDPPLGADGTGYLGHIERWVNELAATTP